MANPNPAVSVLIPAFNAEATLRETLRSALASSYPQLEIIVVDDGSTDSTAAIAEEIAATEPRVRVLRQEHMGVSAALNYGLAQVRSDYIARLDADDLWHPTKIAKQMEVMAEQPDAALVYTLVRYIDPDSKLHRDAEPFDMTGPALCQILYNGITGGGSSALFRHSVLAKGSGYDEGLSAWEDLLVHLDVAARGVVACVPEYLVGYRLRPDSSSANPETSLRNWRKARRRVRRDFVQIPQFVQRWTHARRLLELAEEFAVKGQFIKSVRLVCESLAFDSARTSAYVARRLDRSAKRKEDKSHRTATSFADCDPKTSCGSASLDADTRRARFHKLEQSRQDALQSLDRRIFALRDQPACASPAKEGAVRE